MIPPSTPATKTEIELFQAESRSLTASVPYLALELCAAAAQEIERNEPGVCREAVAFKLKMPKTKSRASFHQPTLTQSIASLFIVLASLSCRDAVA